MRAVASEPASVALDEWRRAVDASAGALAFHTPAWIDAICATHVWRDRTVLFRAESGGLLVAPVVQRRLPPSRGRVSLPFGWGFGGLVATAEVTETEFRAAAAELARSAPGRLRIRPNPLDAARWADAVGGGRRLPRRAHVLSLEGGFETVFESRFKGRARTAVRRAERAGVRIELDTGGRSIPAFYALYEKSLLRWARRAGRLAALRARLRAARDTEGKYRRVAAALGPGCRTWVAWQGETPVAALITLVQGRNTNYWRGAIDGERASQSRASYALQSAAIEDACALGCLTYHMGETGRSRSLAQFKEGFGAEPRDYHELLL